MALSRPLSIPVGRTVGHSYVNGVGGSNQFNGYALRTLRELGCQKHIYSGYSGAVSCHASNTAVGDGGWAWVLNTLWMNDSPFGNSVNLSNALDNWGPRHCFIVHEHALNDLGWLGTNTQPMVEAHRTIWSALNWSRVYHAFNSTAPVYTYSGTWANSSYGQPQAYSSGCKESSVAGSTASMTMPSDMPSGRVLPVGFTVLPGDSATVTISQNGTIVKTYTINGALQCDPATGRTYAGNGVVCRTGTRSSGDGIIWKASDVVTITVASVTSGSVRFNYLAVEADPLDGPIIAAPLPTYLPAAGYAFYATYFSGGGGQGASMSNAVIDAGVAALKALALEFPNRVIPIDMSDLISTASYPLGTYATDGVHPNSDSHGKRAQRVVQKVLQSNLITARVISAFNGPLGSFWYSIGGQAAYGSSQLLGAQLLNGCSQYVAYQAWNASPQYASYTVDQMGRMNFRQKIKGVTNGLAMALINQFGMCSSVLDMIALGGIDDVSTLTSTATGGTFTLGLSTPGGSSNFSGTTVALAYNASSANVQSAIQSVLNGWSIVYSAASVTCSGSLSTGLTVTFGGPLAGLVVTITPNPGSLTGGSLTATHTTTASVMPIRLQVQPSGFGGSTVGNYLIPYFTGTLSWVDITPVTYMLDC